MATRTIANGGGNWSATGTWVEGQVPTAADDVVATATSGALTLDTTGNCRSIDFTNYVSTFNMSSHTLNVGTTTVNGTIAWTSVAGMTLTTNGTSLIAFVSTSGTSINVTTGGKSMPSTTFSGAGGNWSLADAFTTTGTVTLSGGTLSTNNQTCSWGAGVVTGAVTRVLNLGSSSVTITVGTLTWSVSGSGFTINPGTSTITMTGASAVFSGGGATYNNLVFSGSGVAAVQGGTNTFTNLTRIGTAVKTEALQFAQSQVVTGTLTLTGNSVTNRLLVQSTQAGVSHTVTCNGTVTASNVDLMDIAAAGSASWDLHAVTGLSGDCGGNTGITFTASASQTWSGTSGGNWSANAWSSRVPLPQDDVVINAAFVASQTVSTDMPRSGRTINFTGVSAVTLSWAAATSIFGSLTLTAAVTVAASNNLTFAGRSNFTITSAGKTFTPSVFIAAPTGTYTLQDNFVTAGILIVNNGTLDANTKNVTALSFQSLSNLLRTVTMNTGTWTLTGTGTIWNVSAPNLTLNANTATLVIGDSSASAKAMTMATGLSYPAISYTNAGTGSLTLTYTGTTTVASLTVTGAARTLMLTASQTLVVTNGFPTSLLAGTGTGGHITINSSSPGTQATISCAAGELVAEFATISDSAAVGGAQFDAVGQSVSA